MDNNSLVEIKQSSIGENGLFALKNFLEGETVFTLDGEVFDYPTRESIHIGNNKHIHDYHGAYVNHSFDPTTKINGKCVIAVKNINKGDEITFNYNENEINMAAPFVANGILVKGKCTD